MARITPESVQAQKDKLLTEFTRPEFISDNGQQPAPVNPASVAFAPDDAREQQTIRDLGLTDAQVFSLGSNPLYKKALLEKTYTADELSRMDEYQKLSGDDKKRTDARDQMLGLKPTEAKPW